MIIAVDFDGTLCEHKFPAIGGANIPLIMALKELQRQGHKLILWTCRKGNYLDKAVEWCSGYYGLWFDALNDDLPEIKNTDFGREKSQKIFADVYIDDRNIEIQSFVIMALKSENRV